MRVFCLEKSEITRFWLKSFPRLVTSMAFGERDLAVAAAAFALAAPVDQSVGDEVRRMVKQWGKRNHCESITIIYTIIYSFGRVVGRIPHGQSGKQEGTNKYHHDENFKVQICLLLWVYSIPALKAVFAYCCGLDCGTKTSAFAGLMKIYVKVLLKRFSNFRCVSLSFQHVSVILSLTSWASSWSKRAVGRFFFWKTPFWGTSLLTSPSFRESYKISLSLNNPQNPTIQLFQGSSRQNISCLLKVFDYTNI